MIAMALNGIKIIIQIWLFFFTILTPFMVCSIVTAPFIYNPQDNQPTKITNKVNTLNILFFMFTIESIYMHYQDNFPNTFNINFNLIEFRNINEVLT
jgi:hypothetical protein